MPVIERLNHYGEGVADGHPPIPRSLPGEEVDEAGRVLTPSPNRVAAPCRHFKSCGGCAMQHASDDFVARWKREVIKTGLAARGITTDIRETVTSPDQSRRRATLHGKRTKNGALIGFHRRGSDTLIETPDCHVLHPKILACLPLLEKLTRGFASRKAELSFAISVSDAGLDINTVGARALAPVEFASLAHLASEHFVARIAWDGDPVVTHHPPQQRIGPTQVVPPPGAFLQATEHGQTTLTAYVQEIVGDAGHIIDLFAGCGTFTLPLAANAEIWALEGERELLEALDHGWRHSARLKMVTTETRDLFRRPVLASELTKIDAAVIDPPRAGAEAQSRELAKSEVPVIAAISCNPVSFARDAEILTQGGYQLDWVQPVDQFRWSSHVELAAQFTKRHMSRKPR